MAIEIVMPQMGESIFEGTVTKWLKKLGDVVERDEPLFEISTDKVDVEIPSPTGGTLQEIRVEAGATVQVNAIVAVIGEIGTRESKSSVTEIKPYMGQSELDKTSGTVQGDGIESTKTDLVEVVMPQMGESIFEGTITKWLKSTGDRIERDEPLFEVSTDKVDAEIPAPMAGILQEIKAEAGAIIRVNTTVAIIRGIHASRNTAHVAEDVSALPSNKPLAASGVISEAASVHKQSDEKLRSSPLVRKMIKEHNLDLQQINGSGSAGRVTKEDVLVHLGEAEKRTVPATPSETVKVLSSPVNPVEAVIANSGQVVPMTRMRSIIAQRMVESKHTNAHVHTVFKVDMTRIVRLREKEKSKYELRNGVKLTYMPFIARAVTATLRKMPIINASIKGDAIQYHSNVNLGIAVALEWGLIVPVIKEAEERSFLGIARAIADLAERARGKKLKTGETGNSTFTLTNAGIYGEQFGTPIINMPESAILGIGGLFKEPTVLTDDFGADTIAIRSVIHLTLGFDHRIIDGSDAGKFMAEVKKHLEGWSENID